MTAKVVRLGSGTLQGTHALTMHEDTLASGPQRTLHVTDEGQRLKHEDVNEETSLVSVNDASQAL